MESKKTGNGRESEYKSLQNADGILVNHYNNQLIS